MKRNIKHYLAVCMTAAALSAAPTASVYGAWQLDSGSWYYYDNTGTLKTGWLSDGESWYYLYPDTGKMAYSTWVGEYYVGNDGRWITGEEAISKENAARLLKAAFDKAGLYPGCVVTVSNEDAGFVSVWLGEYTKTMTLKNFSSYTINKKTGVAVTDGGGPEVHIKD